MANIVEIIIKAKDDFSKGMNAPIKSMADLQKAATMMGPVLVTAGAAVAVAFGAMMKSAIDLGDQLDEMSQKYGVSASQLSAMKLAAEQSGVSMEGIANGFKFLSKAMAGAAEDGEGTAQVFSAIGVSAKDSNGSLRSSEAVMMDIADKFASYEDGAAKTALALKLFGKAGADMIPLLNQGSVAIKAQMQAARDLGIVMTDEQAAAAGVLNDRLAEMKAASMGLATMMANAVVPMLTDAAVATLKWAKESEALHLILNVLGGVLKLLATVGYGIILMFRGIGMTVGGVIAALVQAIQGDFRGALDTFKEVGAEWNKIEADSMAFSKSLENVSASAIKAEGSLKKLKKSAPVFGTGKEGAGKNFTDFKGLGWKSSDAARIEKEASDNAESMIGYMTRAEIIDKGRNELERQKWLTAATGARVQFELEANRNEEERRQIEETAALRKQMYASMTPAAQFGSASASGDAGGMLSALNSQDGEGTFGETLMQIQAATVQSQAFMDVWREANTTIGESLTTIGMGMRDAITSNLTGIITGAQTAAQAFKNLGRAILQMLAEWVVKYVANKLIMFAVDRATSTASSVLAAKEAAAFGMTRVGAATASVGAGMARALSEYSYPYSLAISAAVAASGAPMIAMATAGMAMAAGGLAGAAHGGLNYVPEETTFLLQRGERVVSPKQNEDLTDFLQGGRGGGNVTELHIDGNRLARWIQDSVRQGRLQLNPA